ncbi:hypothetical protein Leryth_010852 [Lithospermum erythrorhizon]|nr:hypothetical protein Leryth_010852 [Lithospermum erythrorhizon]
MNYTIITSQCKGPEYKPKLCCTPFLEFACPYHKQINDLTNDCATNCVSRVTPQWECIHPGFANIYRAIRICSMQRTTITASISFKK